MSHLKVTKRPVLYGNKAYIQGGFGLVGAFFGTSSQALFQEQQKFNKTMTLFQIVVEHAFGKVSNLWQQDEFIRGNSISISLVVGIYMIAIFLTNCHTCLYDGQTFPSFECTPSSFNEYLGTSHGTEYLLKEPAHMSSS